MKSIVLFLSFRSPLLFAASLSSGEIGTFFALPEWMPRSVSSHDTPGSDPADGGGWYVDEYTNAWEWTEWMVEGRTAPIPTRNGTVWVLWGGSDIPKDWYRIIGVGSDPVSVSDPSNEMSRIEWRTIVYGYPTEDSPLVSRRMPHVHVAVREKNLHPVPTGRRFPRAARLTPEVQASVYATFDAYYERKCFTSQGQSNVWDTAAYGTRTLGPQFAFHKPDGEGDGFVYSPTNRQVSTRRLVEYDNLSALARVLLTDYYYNRLATPVRRPEWIENDQRYDSERMWWSTTASFAGEVDASIFPGFGSGVPNPTRPFLSQWEKRLAVFDSLSPEGVWDGFGSYGPGTVILEHVRFGQDDDSDDYDPYVCRWLPRGDWAGNTPTMAHLIATNYPSADAAAVTNATRRLLSDRLCCVNQVLGLMDRTYHMPKVVYPSVGTNTTYYNEVRYRGDTTVEISYDEAKSEYAARFGPVTWDDGTLTNRVSHGSARTDGTVIARRFSGTTTSAGAAIKLDDAVPPGADINESWIIDFIRSVAESELVDVERGSVAHVYLSPWWSGELAGWLHFVLDLDDADGTRYFFMSGDRNMDVSMTNASVTVFCNYLRMYTYARTWDGVKLKATQPGRDALSTDRVAGSRAGAVIGTHRRTDWPYTPLDPISWDGTRLYNKSIPLYWSKERDYSGRSGIASFLSECEDEVGAAFERFLGVSPTSWRDIIPIDADDALAVRDSVSLDNVGVLLVADVYTMDVTAVIDEVDGGRIVSGHVTSVETVLNDGDYTTIYEFAPAFRYDLVGDPEQDPPEVSERGPLAMDAKIGVLTRVDWDWKTLKRTDD